jgi:hypothetical protein
MLLSSNHNNRINSHVLLLHIKRLDHSKAMRLLDTTPINNHRVHRHMPLRNIRTLINNNHLLLPIKSLDSSRMALSNSSQLDLFISNLGKRKHTAKTRPINDSYIHK